MEKTIKTSLLGLIPYENRDGVESTLKYYESQIDYWSERGYKFKFSRGKITLLLQLSMVAKHVIAPLEDSLSFYERMNNEYGIKSIHMGSTKFGKESFAEIHEAVDGFNKLIYGFLATHKIKKGTDYLKFNEIRDFINLIRIKAS